MVKQFYILFLVLLASCGNPAKKGETVRVAVLKGPTAIAFAQWMEYPPVIDGMKLQVRIIDSPDVMQAMLIQKEADIAVIPTINAANLYNKGVRYTLIGSPVWGTLYMVERKGTDKENRSLHVFGQGTTPDILTRYYLEQKHLTYRLNYTFSTAGEITQALHAGRIHRAVLSEPYVSIALRRDSTLRIIADLNNPDGTSPGYPQTAVLLAPAFAEYRGRIDSLIAGSCRFATTHPAEAISILEKHKLFPAGTLSEKSVERSAIRYLPSAEARESIYRFLELIGSFEPKAIGGKLPDACFINGEP